jgi:hypothetical protein
MGALAALLLITGSYVVMADDPHPPEISNAVVTESSHAEWVTKRSATGEEASEWVTVHEITTAETITIPKKESRTKGGGGVMPLSDQQYPGGVNVTLERRMAWYPHFKYWCVYSKARTYTTYGTCIGGCNVYVEHQYNDGGAWLMLGWDQKLSTGPCHNDSTLAESTPRGCQYLAGTEHRTYGVHVVYVDGVRHEYRRYGPGPMQVP